LVPPGAQQVCLRAERLGTALEGRVYELTLIATDRAGHTTTGATHVSVAHDQCPDDRCPQIPESAFASLDDPRCAVAVANPDRTVQQVTPLAGCQTGGGAEVIALGGLLLALLRRARASAERSQQ
jgi:hypothetical protein